jgi:hypothetical protein
MKVRLLWLIVGVVVVSSAITVREVLNARAQARRAAAAQMRRAATNRSALMMYSENLRPGLTRKDVEDYLRARRTSFAQRCCTEERNTFTDLVKVGEEPAPWYCSEWPVYIALEFAATESHRPPFLPSDSDVLKKVDLVSNGEGCL